MDAAGSYVDVAFDEFEVVGFGDDFAVEGCCCVRHTVRFDGNESST